jgi:hypothetical protein
MNSQDVFGSKPNSGVGAVRDAEATLRLIANLPAPDGLEDRVLNGLNLDGLRSAPRQGRVLTWPGQDWLRTAAAAAIVSVVFGGGWEIYSRVQPGNSISTPVHTGAAGGFSNAGAVRVPQTVPPPAAAPPAQARPSEVKPAKKLHSKVDSGTNQGAKATASGNAAARPSVSVAR